jgi:ERCC4-related helicase
VIQKFKSDNYNVLVSTSIGEEGLDIGEVDLIICYDSQTSPIRMVKKKLNILLFHLLNNFIVATYG